MVEWLISVTPLVSASKDSTNARKREPGFVCLFFAVRLLPPGNKRSSEP